VLRGNHSARIDDKGRLKIPNAFRALVQDQHGAGLYLTSLTGESVLIYPMAVWLAVEQRLSRVPSINPARNRFLDRVNYFGQVSEFDVMIPPRLRESAGMSGEVDVLGQVEYLEVWNHERFLEKLKREPFTEDDARSLSEFGI
jgi:transcriptional regulator MraZ